MKQRIGIFLAFFIFLLQLLLVPLVGMTWDEPSSFFFGRANLKFWQTGDRRYVTDTKNPARFARDPFPFISGEELYPPFAFLIQSAFSYVFSERLYLMNPIDAHHVGEIAIGAVGVWALYHLAVEAGLSIPLAVGTALVYALYPTIFGQMRNDAKDIPLMSMVALTMLWFVRWMKAKTHRRALCFGLLCGLSFGLALATKPTAIAVIPIAVAWYMLISLWKKSTKRLLQFLLTFGVVCLVGMSVAYMLWPWLWDDPIGKLTRVWSFFKTVGYKMPVPYRGFMYWAGISVPWYYPLGILFFQTPLPIFFFGIIGMGVASWDMWKRRQPYRVFFLLWFVLGMSRFLVPGVLIYARVRHFIDVMPAFFVLMGVGVDWIASSLSAGRQGLRKWIVFVLLFMMICHQVYISVRLFPYEPSYFNILAGGVQGVSRDESFDVSYWASEVKEAVEFINKNAPTGSRIYPCQLRHLVHFYLRPDLVIADIPETATYALVPHSISWFGSVYTYYNIYHDRVFTVRRDNADFMAVYRSKSPTGWRCGDETEMVVR